MRFHIASICAIGLLSVQSAQAFTISVENPNTFSASTSVGTTQQVDFEDLPLGLNTGYNVDFPDAASGDTYKATYDSLRVYNYGNGSTTTAGAGYTGKFVANFDTQASPDGGTSVTTTNLTFTDQTQGGVSAGVRYFGLFLSSFDAQNQFTIYNGDAVVAQFRINDISSFVNNNTAYVGGPFGEYGAFFNFFADGSETFTRVQFTQVGGGGFENDNHTFRVPDAQQRTGTAVNLSALNVTGGSVQAVPEPSPFMGGAVLGTIFAGLAFWRNRRKVQHSGDIL
jgi:hypothetical protein